MNEDNKILVVGHTNPDTDSICSAIAYAQLKGAIDGKNYEACRAGKMNEETRFVLTHFGVEEPPLLEDVRTQVRDIEIRKTPGMPRTISLKEAWELMKELSVVTLPITNKKRLEGILTTEDITKSFMDGYDNTVLSRAHTRYTNIVSTLNGNVLVGDEKAYFTTGKVLLAAANPDLMEQYIEEHDLVILGNRYESQLCAIEMGAACLVVCDGAPVSKTICKLAQEKGCTVITTDYDTFITARLINQSMPVSYYMKKDRLTTFEADDYIEDIRETMAKMRNRDFPIIDANGNYLGMISRRNLLGARKKQIILVDHNERTQAVHGVDDAEILEIIDHHRLGAIETMAPVFFRNQPLGCTATIIYQMYQESGQSIPKATAGLLCSAIISDTLLFRSPTCTELDKIAAKQLAKTAGIALQKFAREMFAAASNLSGKTPEQIFYQDFKRFSIEGKTIGVGQISSMNPDELSDLEQQLTPYLEQAINGENMDMVFFMLTNILDESSILLCNGNGAAGLAMDAFHVKGNCPYHLPGIISRKKQLIPALMMAVQNI